jgi:hypothetical protein
MILFTTSESRSLACASYGEIVLCKPFRQNLASVVLHFFAPFPGLTIKVSAQQDLPSLAPDVVLQVVEVSLELCQHTIGRYNITAVHCQSPRSELSEALPETLSGCAEPHGPVHDGRPSSLSV